MRRTQKRPTWTTPGLTRGTVGRASCALTHAFGQDNCHVTKSSPLITSSRVARADSWPGRIETGFSLRNHSPANGATLRESSFRRTSFGDLEERYMLAMATAHLPIRTLSDALPEPMST